jgi:hypothetical protein
MTVKILIISGALVLVLLFFLLKMVKKMHVAKAKELLERYKGRNILALKYGANFFGQESLGYTQVRGNCSLIIMGDEIVSEMWLPKRILRIPAASVISFETPKSYLGKSRGVRLLKVVFTNENGLKDSAAWRVRNLDETVQLLRSIILN